MIDNKLIGRGANDMKASIACFVAAASKFKAKNKKFNGSISLLITGDEEGIAINGTKRVVEYLKRKLNAIFRSITKKAKCRFQIIYEVSGEAFLTKPNKTTFMIQNIIKKITRIKPKLSTAGGTSDARFIRKIAPSLEFGLVGKTMHKIDESVPLSDLKKLTKIYLNILENYFK